MEIYYGMTNYSQLKHIAPDNKIMVSARLLMGLSPKSKVYGYLKQADSVFLDSGAFGCAMFDGGFTWGIDDYIELVRRVNPEVWVTMDYPCEPDIMKDMTTNQRILATLNNTKALLSYKVPGLLPVIQGWEIDDYLQCVDLMEEYGLIDEYMGIGSICRRGSQSKIVAIVSELRNRLPRVAFHAFGVKISALSYNRGELLNYLYSLDTAAWQFKQEPGPYRRPKRSQDYPKLFAEYSVKLCQRANGPYQLTLER